MLPKTVLMKPKVYLAGPLGFYEAGQFYYSRVLVPYVRDQGFDVLDPWEIAEATMRRLRGLGLSSEALAGALASVNDEIAEQNRRMIDRSDFMLAILDGSDVDSGTAAEIGYAAARNKVIVGIRSDLRMSGDNSATSINLQVAYFVRLSGGGIARNLPEAGSLLSRLAMGWRMSVPLSGTDGKDPKSTST
jgi:nucleoside 2-deoxyribosyltransferase